MKRFSLNTKRVSKVLALALVASLVVPSVPAQTTVVEAAGSQVELPEVVGSEGFDSATGILGVADEDGKRLKFTDKLVTTDWGEGDTTSQSLDKQVVKKGDNYVYETVDVNPEIVKKDAVYGNALYIKDSVDAVQYPSNPPSKGDYIVQEAKTFHSGVEIDNPFTEYRDDLYVATSQSFDYAYDTATKVERATGAAAYGKLAVGPNDIEESYVGTSNKWAVGDANFTKYKNRLSSPEAKTGVTLSFWAKTPYAPRMDTNFFEFSNTESLVYSDDDLGKAWIAYQYDKISAVGTGTGEGELNNPSSPFYVGEAIEVTMTQIHNDAKEAVKNQLGLDSTDEIKTDGSQKVTVIVNHGIYAKWNPAILELSVEDKGTTPAAIEKLDSEGAGTGVYQAFFLSEQNGYYPTSWMSKAQSKCITASVGVKDSTGEEQVASYRLSGDIYSLEDPNGNYAQYRPTKEAPYGIKTRIVEGATGWLKMGVGYDKDTNGGANTGKVDFIRNNNSTYLTGKIITPGREKEDATCQSNTNGFVYNPEVGEAAEDEDWHYYTVTITDEWFQVYVDGDPCDPQEARVYTGNSFNMGSGMYAPDGSRTISQGAAKANDWYKICNSDWQDTIYGKIFGESVMSFISDPKTKLYVGGKTANTAAGTMVDEMTFYLGKMDEDQAAYAYELAQEKAKELYVPEAVTGAALDSASDFVAAEGATGEKIKFGSNMVTTSWPMLDENGQPVEGYLPGDVDQNGKLQPADALGILGHASGDPDAKYDDDFAKKYADVNKDGKVQSTDALAVLEHAGGGRQIEKVGGSYESYDPVVTEKAVDGKTEYEKESFNVSPTIATDSERGSVLEIKGSEKVARYPSNEKVAAVQEEKTYYSAAEIDNPFTAYRDVLYDADRYTFDKAAKTATEVERYVTSTEVDTWEYDDSLAYGFADLRNRYSSPEAKTGVTMSFWAKTAEDVETTTFFEFYNTDSLVYKTNDLGKAWIAYQYELAKSTGYLNDEDSPFYIGEEFEGTIVSVSDDCKADVVAQLDLETKEDIKTDGTQKFTALINHGMYMKWNPAAVETNAAIPKDAEGQFKVYAPVTLKTDDKAAKKELVIESGRTDKDGKKLYYHLKWSDTIFAEGAKDSYYEKFRVTDEAPYGINTNTGKGATGHLYMGTTVDKDLGLVGTTYYNRDDVNFKAGAVGANPKGDEYEKQGIQCQHNTNAGVNNPEVATAVSDGKWHYYTITITDEWFQVYVDGKACDPEEAKAWSGDTFNLGSSMYAPDGSRVNNNDKTDFQKICNDDWTGSIYGQLFGESVMNFITNPQTKLFLGGKTQETTDGTFIDDIKFYTEVLDEKQVESVYKALSK